MGRTTNSQADAVLREASRTSAASSSTHTRSAAPVPAAISHVSGSLQRRMHQAGRRQRHPSAYRYGGHRDPGDGPGEQQRDGCADRGDSAPDDRLVQPASERRERQDLCEPLDDGRCRLGRQWRCERGELEHADKKDEHLAPTRSEGQDRLLQGANCERADEHEACQARRRCRIDSGERSEARKCDGFHGGEDCERRQPEERGAQRAGLRSALLGLAPLAVLATVEAVAFAGLAPLTEVGAASSAGLAAFVLVGALAIGALQQAILALAPRRGQVLVLLVGVLQLASLAAPLPPQTAPTVIQWLAEVLPLPALTGGLNQAIVGGAVTSVGTTVALLLAWTIAGVAVTAVAVRRRVALTSPSLVHPALQAA